MLGISPGAAADFIGQALALRHRLPLTWARVQAGEATPWKARKIATACLDLPEDAARAVDRRVARVVDSLTPIRLDKIVEAAKTHADPDARPPEGRGEGPRTRRLPRPLRRARHQTDPHPHRLRSRDPVQRPHRQHRRSLEDPRRHQPAAVPPRRRRRHHRRPPLHRRTPPPSPPVPEHPTRPTRATRQRHPPTQPPTQAAAPAGRRDAADRGRTGPPPRHRRRRSRSRPRQTSPSTPPATAGVATAAAPALLHGCRPPPPSAADRQCAPLAECPTRRPPPASARRGVDAEPGMVRLRWACTRRHCGAYSGDEGLLEDWAEPGLDDEADRDAPHPSDSDLPDPLDTPFKEAVEPFDPGLRLDRDHDDGRTPRRRGAPRAGRPARPDQARRPHPPAIGPTAAAWADRDLRAPHRPHPGHRHRRTPC